MKNSSAITSNYLIDREMVAEDFWPLPVFEETQQARTDTTANTLTDSPINLAGGWFMQLRRLSSYGKRASNESAT